MLAGVTPAWATFHLMQIEQVIGGVNGDTTAQAIQLRMRSAGQNLLPPSRIRAWDANGANPVVVVDFTANVPNGASGARVLVATPAFASYTSPAAVSNATMTAIPASYLAAGSLTFETDNGLTIYWRLSWGGGAYTGSNAGSITNDADGNFGPPFAGSLPSSGVQAVRFNGLATAMSTNNAADYSLTPGAATFNNNAGTAFLVSPPALGACCSQLPGTCAENVTQAACSGQFQVWTDGMSCLAAPPCVQVGACCDELAGTCTNGITEASCGNVNESWTGGVLCANLVPACEALGACCDGATGTCQNDIGESACQGAFQQWTGGSTCAALDPQCEMIGACCDLATGTCADNVAESACDGVSTFSAGTTCASLDPPCEPIQPELLAISLETIATGLVSPVSMVDFPNNDDRIFVVDQIGQIRVIENGVLLPTPFLDVTSLLPSPNAAFDERGLLGMAFHPDYINNGRFFIRYSKPRASSGSEPCDLDTFITGCHSEVLAEYAVLGDPQTSNVADPGSEIILLSIDKPQWNHNAGTIAFGPDGYLYMSTGDGGGAHDGLADDPPSHGPIGSGQDIESLLGKMLRIDVDSPPTPPNNYAIPAGNPFVGVAGRDEIFAYGLRNPYKFSFDSVGGNLLVADVGQNIYEEINAVTIGGNYGWAVREGFECFDPFNPDTPPMSCAPAAVTDPLLVYEHAVAGLAVVGGYRYHGSAYPQLQGTYVFGDFSADFGPTGRLYYFGFEGPAAFIRGEFFLAPDGQPFGRALKGFGEDEYGELYVLASTELGPTGTTGVVLRIAPPQPLAEPVGSRYIAVTPPEGEGLFGLRVRVSDCPLVERFVGPPAGPFNIAHLVANPANAAFLSHEGWGHTVVVAGPEIVPDSDYQIRSDVDPLGLGTAELSPPSSVHTWRYGDANNSGIVNLDDIICVLNGFSSSFSGLCTIYSTDLRGDNPNEAVTIDDILAVLAAFGGNPYPGTQPCP